MNAEGKLALLILGTCLLAYSYVHQGPGGGTPTSRLDLLRALVERGTLEIDAYHDNTPDKAYKGGHFYSDKAPGTALLCLPSFAMASFCARALHVPPGGEREWLFLSWFTTATSIAVIGSLGAVCCFRLLCRMVDRRSAFVTTMGVFLGSAPFPYATMLHSHAITIAILFTMLRVELITPHSLGAASHGLLGFLAGLCICCEYSSGLVVLGVVTILRKRSVTEWLAVGFGALRPLLLIPLYHASCFGEPLGLAYYYDSVFLQNQKGLCGVTFVPNLDHLYTLLLSPARGFLFWSPLFLLSGLGCGISLSQGNRYYTVLYLVSVVHVLALSSYWDPYAGLSIGARYLSPIVPLLTLPTAFGMSRFPRLGLTLTTVSVLLTGLGTAVNAQVSGSVGCPLTEYHLPMLAAGQTVCNLGWVLGLHGGISLCPLLLAVVVACVLGWRWSSMAGELIGSQDVGSRRA